MITVRILTIFLIQLLPGFPKADRVLTSKDLMIQIYSQAPLEDIKAVSKTAYGVINATTGDIQLGVSIKSLQFPKSLMQEHFNENYMESEKYPAAKFKGKLNSPIDISKDGEYQVTATGDLDVHGVVKRRTIPGKIKVSNGQVELSSEFDVKCVDHNIEIPSIVFQKVAETIKVTFKGTFNSKT